MAEEIRFGKQPKIIEIWSALAINQINSEMDYEQAKQVLEKAHFDGVFNLHTFLMYNRHDSRYQTSIWKPDSRIRYGDLYSDKSQALKNLAVLADDFLHEQQRFIGEIKILTYPRAYRDVENIVRETLRPVVHPDYNEGPHPRKGEFRDIITKVTPTLKTTEREERINRTSRLIKSQNRYRNDGIRFR